MSPLSNFQHPNWKGVWTRVDEVARQLREEHPESFRFCRVKCRNGQIKSIGAFSKTVRLRKYGKKRLVIVHEKEDLSDNPRFLVTSALHWESTRVYQTWTYRWSVEVFHEFSKQIIGLESAQVRREEGVKRHFCLSCVAQSILQRVIGSGQTSERFKFAQEKQTIGQRLYSLYRESFSQLLLLIEGFFTQGQSPQQILEVLMPA